LPYILRVADRGVDEALRSDPALRRGVNVYRGALVHRDVAESLGRDATPIEDIIGPLVAP
jgi:alanine dehydrogenase